MHQARQFGGKFFAVVFVCRRSRETVRRFAHLACRNFAAFGFPFRLSATRHAFQFERDDAQEKGVVPFAVAPKHRQPCRNAADIFKKAHRSFSP